MEHITRELYQHLSVEEQRQIKKNLQEIYHELNNYLVLGERHFPLSEISVYCDDLRKWLTEAEALPKTRPDQWEFYQLQRLVGQIRTSLEEMKEQREEFITELWEKERRHLTGIDVLDILLEEKFETCRLKQIKMQCDCLWVPKAYISITDLFSLFKNLLDNAIEAAVQGEEKTIRVVTTLSKGFWGVKVCNTKAEKYHPQHFNMATTKGNRDTHGHGVGIIRRIVDKYDGEIMMKDRGREFDIFIAIPLVELCFEGRLQK